jgi:hypothetical protein
MKPSDWMALHDPGRVYVRRESVNDWRVFILLDGSARWRAWGVNVRTGVHSGWMYLEGSLAEAADAATQWAGTLN